MMRRILPTSMSRRCGLLRTFVVCSPLPPSPVAMYMTRQSGSPGRAVGLKIRSAIG